MARKGKLGQKQTKNEIERPVRWKKYQYLFLIVCEDQNTEPSYFAKFEASLPEHTLFLRCVGAGLDPLGVSERAIQEMNLLEKESNREVDTVWIVFDKDDADLNAARVSRFTNAFEIAKENNMNIAWSNEVFELWLLLHFIEVQPETPIPRITIYEMLEQSIKQLPGHSEFVYEHGNDEVIDIIQEAGNEIQAKLRAEHLCAAHINTAAINANPCTKVHLLVQELRSWIDYYNYSPA